MTELLATAFRFAVTFAPSPTGGAAATPIGSGGFAEVTGLEVEMDIAEFAQGGRNNGVIQRIGRAKVPRLTLRRGMVHPPDGVVAAEFWTWLSDCVSGVFPIRRYDVTVAMKTATGVVATWSARRALPAKVAGPALNAKTGEVAIEELQLAHEGLRMVAS